MSEAIAAEIKEAIGKHLPQQVSDARAICLIAETAIGAHLLRTDRLATGPRIAVYS